MSTGINSFRSEILLCKAEASIEACVDITRDNEILTCRREKVNSYFNEKLPLFTLIFLLILTVICINPIQTLASSNRPDSLKSLSAIPVPFIKNNGQVSSAINFYAATFDGPIFITNSGEIVYSLPKLQSYKHPSGFSLMDSIYTEDSLWGNRLRERIIGGKVGRIEGKDKSITRVNYFKGNEPDRLQTNAETFNEVSLGEIYKGINLILKAHGNNVEKIFYVRPDADPSLITMGFEGGRIENIDNKGELQIKTASGIVSFTKPVAYQEIGGKRQYVTASYKLKEGGYGYGFEVGNYDKTKDLIIDPLLSSTFIGGMHGNEFINAMAIDSEGNVYVAGKTDDASNFSSWASYQGFYDGNGGWCSINNDLGIHNDAFILKLSSDLSTLLAYTFIGGSDLDVISAMAIDSDGNILVSGGTFSADYPVTAGAYDTSYGNLPRWGNVSWYGKTFISKFSPDLSILLASTYIGGTSGGYAPLLALDADGDVYITGNTNSHDYPTTAGAYNTSFHGIYLSKLSYDLSTLLASTFIGGSGSDSVTGISLDGDGNIYIAGGTGSKDFPITATAYRKSLNGNTNTDAFVSKFDPDLSTLLASTYIGGKSSDSASAVAIDNIGNVYIAGKTASTDYPTTEDAYDPFFNGDSYNDVFISKLDSDLSSLLASTYIGGIYDDSPSAMALDISGNVYLTGTASNAYPTTAGAYNTSNGNAFISKMNPDLTTLLVSTFIGSSPSALSIDENENVYVAGSTTSISYPSTAGAYDINFNGGNDGCQWHYDGFVSKFDGDLSASMLSITKSGAGSGTISSSPSGIDCGTECSVAFSPEKVVTLTATPDTGTTFIGWSGGGCSGTGTCTVTMEVSRTVTAMFYLYPLTVNKTGAGSGSVTSSSGGINCGPDCMVDYDYQSVVTLTATPIAGSFFGGWSGGGCSGTDACTVTMDAGKTVTAMFYLNQNALTISKTGTGSGSITSSPAGIECGSDCSEAYS